MAPGDEQRVQTEAEVILEYRQRCARHRNRGLRSALTLLVLALLAAWYTYLQFAFVQQHPFLLAGFALVFGRPILARVGEALRYRPHCPVCELGRPVRVPGGTRICSHCQARLG
jgi:hypothetical protein